MRRLRRLAGLLLPQGKAAAKLGFVWDGVLPAGWVPIKERRKQMRAAGRGGRGARRGKREPAATAAEPF